ncbi:MULTISPECIES: hypothetical protein [unclassified Calothrix]|nr:MULTISPECIES: hypothetical protein [unclassified Calothrix]
MPHDASCYNAGNPRNALAPPCPLALSEVEGMPHAQCPFGKSIF